MIDLKKAAITDPLQRNVEKGLEQIEHSPMDPPSAYEQPAEIKDNKVINEASIQEFVDEHKLAMKHIEEFEKGLTAYKATGYLLNPEINKAFASFFKFFDEILLPHNDKEEKCLFPILREKLIAAGEHSTGEVKVTAIEVMEDDHVKFIQLGSLTFNLLGLATRIRDEGSKIFILDTAYENGRELVELLKLHIYREDYTLFPLAQKYLSHEEFQAIEKKMHEN